MSVYRMKAVPVSRTGLESALSMAMLKQTIKGKPTRQFLVSKADVAEKVMLSISLCAKGTFKQGYNRRSHV